MKLLNIEASTVELVIEVCNIESVSKNEQALADAIEATLAQFAHLTLTRDGNALVARTELGRDQRVIIAGHIDTVPVADNLPAQLMHFEREQVVWGRGSVDMKASIAVMLKLAASLQEPKYDITWVFYDQEEIDADLNGLKRLVSNYPDLLQADFAILGEPSGAQLEGGCNGTLRFELKTKGIAAHSARPWMGSNAIHSLSGALQILSDYQPAEIDVGGLVYKESLNAVKLSAGVANNVIPDSAVMTINYRFAPSRVSEVAFAEMESLFLGFDLKLTDAANGANPGLDRAVIQDFIASLGIEPRPKYGWTDVARFSELGIPAVNYGAGDPSKAHADDESVPVGHIAEMEQGLRSWLTSLS